MNNFHSPSHERYSPQDKRSIASHWGDLYGSVEDMRTAGLRQYDDFLGTPPPPPKPDTTPYAANVIDLEAERQQREQDRIDAIRDRINQIQRGA